MNTRGKAILVVIAAVLTLGVIIGMFSNGAPDPLAGAQGAPATPSNPLRQEPLPPGDPNLHLPPSGAALDGPAPTDQSGVDSEPYSSTPEGEQGWNTATTGFADNFTNGTPGWLDRLTPFISPYLVGQLVPLEQNLDSVPSGNKVAIEELSRSDYGVIADITYDTGLVVRVRVDYDGANWLVTSYERP